MLQSLDLILRTMVAQRSFLSQKVTCSNLRLRHFFFVIKIGLKSKATNNLFDQYESKLPSMHRICQGDMASEIRNKGPSHRETFWYLS